MTTLTTEEMGKLEFWLPRPISGTHQLCTECQKNIATIATETGNWCDACAREMFDVADVMEDRRLEAHYQIAAGTGEPADPNCECVHCQHMILCHADGSACGDGCSVEEVVRA